MSEATETIILKKPKKPRTQKQIDATARLVASNKAKREAKALAKSGASAPEPVPKQTEVKKKKPKRVISDAERQRLKENLAKGRATSLANRQKKAKLKKIKKEEDSKADDEKIFESLKKKLQPDALKGENDTLKKELEMLRSEMRSMKERKVERPSTPPPKAKPEKIQRPIKDRRSVKSAATEDSDDDAPAPPPPPPPKKEMSKRDIMKMMRGL